MTDVKQSVYYQRLSKLALWPVLGFAGLVTLIVLIQVLMIYFSFVPGLLDSVAQSASPEVVAIVAYGFDKVVVNLSVWIFSLLVVNASLVYVVWNVRNLLAILRDTKD